MIWTAEKPTGGGGGGGINGQGWNMRKFNLFESRSKSSILCI